MLPYIGPQGFPVGLVVKNPQANSGDIRDVGSTPGSRGLPGGGHAVHFSIITWRIPWILVEPSYSP